MKTILLIIVFFNSFSLLSQNVQENLSSSNLRGPYLGQKLPGTIPELFAPEIISDGMPNRDVAVSPSGDEMYFSISTPNFQFSTIIYTKRIDSIWTKPEVASFAQDPRYKYTEPAFSNDGNTLFLLQTCRKVIL